MAADFWIVYKRFDWDDGQLGKAYRSQQNEVAQMKRQLRRCEMLANAEQYLNLVLARLAYRFAKETYEILEREMDMRGLLHPRKSDGNAA